MNRRDCCSSGDVCIMLMAHSEPFSCQKCSKSIKHKIITVDFLYTIVFLIHIFLNYFLKFPLGIISMKHNIAMESDSQLWATHKPCNLAQLSKKLEAVSLALSEVPLNTSTRPLKIPDYLINLFFLSEHKQRCKSSIVI